jgi:hypothetical protein
MARSRHRKPSWIKSLVGALTGRAAADRVDRAERAAQAADRRAAAIAGLGAELADDLAKALAEIAALRATVELLRVEVATMRLTGAGTGTEVAVEPAVADPSQAHVSITLPLTEAYAA